MPGAEHCMRVSLPYLDNWLICMPSRAQVAHSTTVLLSHMAWLGLIVNFEKTSLTPSQSTTFIGVALNSVTMRASACG
ncbi:uncharacterized protein AKAME5_001306600 [Lates japonicus]|uniref:Reverse transcriptase n=1 Tax=Lates japonicus TaxID=270547 RepID=A0AAD3MVY6_LATJO|nr:uncharacterized protein AKAME5_001306600 [Lates japonicus]